MSKKVFVSGCYDMLHSGHVAFFKEAASHGDLYVGIGSDATIRELKDRKTINTERERLYMVKAIRYVKDAFVNSGSGILDFAEDVKRLKPDIFFVNSDGYTPGKKRFCEENGASMKQANLLQMAVEEICMTTILKAFTGDSREYIQVTLVRGEEGRFTLLIRNSAQRFNPFDMKMGKVTREAEEEFLDFVRFLKMAPPASSYIKLRLQNRFSYQKI